MNFSVLGICRIFQKKIKIYSFNEVEKVDG